MSEERFVILCVAAESALAGSLRSLVTTLTDDQFEVESYADAAAMRERFAGLAAQGVLVPLVIASDRAGDEDGITALESLGRSAGGTVRTLLLTRQPGDAEAAAAEGAIDAYLTVPWRQADLEETIDRLVTSYLIERDPVALEQVPDIVDVELLTHAFSESEERGRAVRVELEEARLGMLAFTDLSDDQVEDEMIREIDRVLDHPPRETYRAGAKLLESGQSVDGVTVVLEGRMNLSVDVDGVEVPFHVRTAGRLLGILALARNEPAYFSARAITDIRAIRLSVDDLERAMQQSPTLGGLFMSVLLRSMVRRMRRSVELRLEVNRLAAEVREERDQLALALQQLDGAQSQLIEQEKMALLGQLVAGVAHELNNPIAAILRATEFIEDDVASLTTRHPEAQLFTDTLLDALHAEPMSTRTEREQRRTLAADLGDDALAGRLVRAGITSSSRYDEVFGRVPDAAHEDLLETLEGYRRLGTAIRNLRAGSERIRGLVGSLRSYARRPEDVLNDVDVREGIDETLLLLGHRLRQITVERRYDPVPTIRGRPGELNQVWTNLVVNAIQVMEGPGTLEVVTDQPDAETVRVQIIDSGPGIAKEDVDRIFDLAFTTKQGRVDFGLGLGLRIAQDIVSRHHGSIEVESRPGRTCFAVLLPTRPDLEEVVDG